MPTYLKRFRRWLHRPRPTRVSLEALSALWVDMPGANGIEEGEQEVRWLNHEINSFYESYVRPYAHTLGRARAVVEQILTILDHHGTIPSVEESSSAKTQVTLREHSLNTAREAIDMVKKRHKDHEMMAPKVLITALGHCLGLTSDANILGGVPAKSILILEPMVQDLPYKDAILEAIRTYKDSKPKTPEAKILKTADMVARKKESERLLLLSATPGVPIDLERLRREDS